MSVIEISNAAFILRSWTFFLYALFFVTRKHPVKDETDIIDNHNGQLGYKMVVENIDANGMVNFHIEQIHDVPQIYAK